MTNVWIIVSLVLTPAMIPRQLVKPLLDLGDTMNVLANSVLKDWEVIWTVVHQCHDLATQEVILATKLHPTVPTALQLHTTTIAHARLDT